MASIPSRPASAEIFIETASICDGAERRQAEDVLLHEELRERNAELEQRMAALVSEAEGLRELQERLQQARDGERRRMAGELHDGTEQTLMAVAMNLETLGNYAERDAPHLAPGIEENRQLVRQAVQEIRAMAYRLHPPLLEESGLAAALDWYVRGLAERSGLAIRLDVARDLGRLPSHVELAIFRIVQESLSNVQRHSGSKTAEVHLGRVGGTVSLEIEDHGQGIAAEKPAEIERRGPGLGLARMRERVRQLGGRLDIESSVELGLESGLESGGESNGAGTRVAVTLPAAAARLD